MTARSRHADNNTVTARLREAVALLRAQGASRSRLRPYLDAAESIESMARDVRAVFIAGGVKALDAIPRVGLGIASAIAEMLAGGRWAMLDRLRGLSDPVVMLQAVPGIGETLAELIHHRLDIDSLEDLEEAAHAGRLFELKQVGEKRAALIESSVAAMLGRPYEQARHETPGSEPGVELLLGVDREYRMRAARGELELIAPKRFNPDASAWLPVLHTSGGGWHFTALYSNTALAHKLGRIHDWVVIYYYDADHVEHSRTVVTEPHGPQAGRRVVRGREDECLRLPRVEPADAPLPATPPPEHDHRGRLIHFTRSREPLAAASHPRP